MTKPTIMAEIIKAEEATRRGVCPLCRFPMCNEEGGALEVLFRSPDGIYFHNRCKEQTQKDMGHAR